jgi:hypothetical protein
MRKRGTAAVGAIGVAAFFAISSPAMACTGSTGPAGGATQIALPGGVLLYGTAPSTSSPSGSAGISTPIGYLQGSGQLSGTDSSGEIDGAGAGHNGSQTFAFPGFNGCLDGTPLP